jgi:predicted Zn-dependent peptidase
MRKIVLPNGLVVLFERTASDSVSVEVSVGVGSDFEGRMQAGVSHFLEHMLFNGSVRRPTAFELTNTIERLGGVLNGGTSNEQTCFYAKVPRRHLGVMLDVLGDMLFNPLIRQADVEKERRVISDEIRLFTDDPKLHVWVLLQKRLYVRHPAKNPVYGSLQSVRRLNRNDLTAFHRRYYVPRNMFVSIVGGVDAGRALALVERYFGAVPSGCCASHALPAEPKQTSRRVFREKRSMLQSYFVLAYKTVPRRHRDSYVLDVIHAILGRRSSGRIFDEVRNKRGLAYEVSVQHEALKTFGFFAVYVVADRNNIREIVDLITGEFRRLGDITPREVEEAKTFIEGDFLLENEDTLKRAQLLGFFNHASCVEDAADYILRIRAVSTGDVRRLASEYLSENYTLVSVEQKRI